MSDLESRMMPESFYRGFAERADRAQAEIEHTEYTEIATRVAAIESDLERLRTDMRASFERVFVSLDELRRERQRRPRWPWQT